MRRRHHAMTEINDSIFSKYQLLKQKSSFSAGELEDTEVPPKRWIIEGYMDDEGMDMVIGRPKDGKSLLILAASICISVGRPFMGRTTTKCKVLYADEENGIRRLKERQQKIVTGMQLTPSEKENLRVNLKYSSLKGIIIDKESGVQKLKQLIEEHQPNLIVIDSLVRAMTGKENEVADARKVFSQFKAIQSEFSFPLKFLPIHHVVKSRKSYSQSGRLTAEDARGSSDFAGQVNNMLIVNRTSPTSNGVQYFDLTVGLERDTIDSKGVKYKVYDKLFLDKTGVVFEPYGEAESKSQQEINSVEECAQSIMDWVKTNNKILFKRKELDWADSDYGGSTITIALNLLVERNELAKGGKKGWYKVASKEFG